MEDKKQLIALTLSSLLAGVCISIVFFVFLNVGGVSGAVLFAFGLLAVVHYRLTLYTGMAGFVSGRDFLDVLPWVLICNIVGCFVCATGFAYAEPQVVEKCVNIIASRNEHRLRLPRPVPGVSWNHT